MKNRRRLAFALNKINHVLHWFINVNLIMKTTSVYIILQNIQ